MKAGSVEGTRNDFRADGVLYAQENASSFSCNAIRQNPSVTGRSLEIQRCSGKW